METLIRGQKTLVFVTALVGLFFIPGLFNESEATNSCGYSWIEVPIFSPSPPPPSCELSASDTTIAEGESTVLSWTTNMGPYYEREWVFIEPGFCSVADSGSLSVSPTETTTYKLFAVGTHTGANVPGHYRSDMCEVTITVEPPVCTAPLPHAEISYTGDNFAGGYASWEWSWENKNKHYAEYRKFGCDDGSSIGWSPWTPAEGLDNGQTESYYLDESHAGCTYEIKYTVENVCGATDSDVASVTISSIDEPEYPVCDYFDITPSSRTGSGNVTFEWGTTNADSVHINNGVGPVSADGSKVVYVTQSGTYTLTATNADGSDTCTDTVTVVPETPDRFCELYASDTTINEGEYSTLTWFTNFPYIDWMSIDQGIGSVTRYGSELVSPDETTTYTLTVDGRESPSGPTSQVMCHKTITVIPKEPELPVCEWFTATPDELVGSGFTKLEWQTTNASFVTISDIGIVERDGSRDVWVEDDTTWTLTALNSDGEDMCEASVRVIPEEPEYPVCDEFTITPATREGEGNVTFEWSTTNATNVSIDNGIGDVDVDGTREVYVTDSGTYTLTASDDNGRSDTCVGTVTVIPIEEPEYPVCDTFTATPESREGAGDITLAWETTGATNVSIDNGIGDVDVDGSQSVYVSEDTTWTLTATNDDGSVTCETSVDILPEEEIKPTCDAFTVSPASREGAGTVTLSWETTDAKNVSIDNGVGDVEDDGSKEVFVSEDTTWTLTATNDDGSVTCETSVDIVPEGEDYPLCDTFTATPASRTGAGDITLAWETTNATDVSISNGVGDVEDDGSKTIRVSSDTTWTLTATNDSGSVSCSTSVDIRSSGGGGSSKPRCDLEVSDKEVESGDYVTLSWDNTRTSDILLEDDHGETYINTKRNEDDEDEYDEDEDSIRIKVTEDTEFTLTAFRGSKDDECSVEVEVEGEVAGISFTGTRYQDFINLASTPYTGFEAGKVLTFLFYLAIGLWAAAIAYALLLKKKNDSLVMESAGTAYVPTFAENLSAVENTIRHDVPENTLTAPVIEETDVVEGSDTKSLEDYAHTNYTLISSDALAYVESQAGTLEEQMRILDTVIEDARSKYPKEGDWLVLSKERILSLLD